MRPRRGLIKDRAVRLRKRNAAWKREPIWMDSRPEDGVPMPSSDDRAEIAAELKLPELLG
jgi:hypothetical protein